MTPETTEAIIRFVVGMALGGTLGLTIAHIANKCKIGLLPSLIMCCFGAIVLNIPLSLITKFLLKSLY